MFFPVVICVSAIFLSLKKYIVCDALHWMPSTKTKYFIVWLTYKENSKQFNVYNETRVYNHETTPRSLRYDPALPLQRSPLALLLFTPV